MARTSIPVDLFNPGQVFACLGLLELSEITVGPSRAAFDWSDAARAEFLLECEGQANPVERGLQFLEAAEVESLAPEDPALATEKWKVPTRRTSAAEGYPVPPPSSPAALPAILRAGGTSVTLSSWAEANLPDLITPRRDNVKFWAGMAGYPGVALVRDALDAARPHLDDAAADPFSVSTPMSSGFRFDWRSDYIPIDVGFSLNSHSAIQTRGFPLVELLAAVGLSHARPKRLRKLEYRYAVVGRDSYDDGAEPRLLPAGFLRAALGAASLPFPQRTFAMHLDWPGQENQARCITQVLEENLS